VLSTNCKAFSFRSFYEVIDSIDGNGYVPALPLSYVRMQHVPHFVPILFFSATMSNIKKRHHKLSVRNTWWLFIKIVRGATLKKIWCDSKLIQPFHFQLLTRHQCWQDGNNNEKKSVYWTKKKNSFTACQSLRFGGKCSVALGDVDQSKGTKITVFFSLNGIR
jgi:hypothetical protein